MPRYLFRCEECGAERLLWRSVEGRDRPDVCPCGGVIERRFLPTANIVVPGHFRLPADWCLPDKEDKAAWEQMGTTATASQTHAPKEEKFSDYFDRTTKGLL